MRKHWRIVLSRAPLPMLALAASYGVYSFALLFVPQWVALVQAAAFECCYVGLAVVDSLDSNQRRRATLISVGAVLASIIYNSLSGWLHRSPHLIAQASDLSWLALAILHGAPLAWVAYLVSDLLLHAQPSQAPAQAVQALPVEVDALPLLDVDTVDSDVQTPVKPVKRITSSVDSDILAMRAAGMSYAAIGARLGMSRQSVQQRHDRAASRVQEVAA